MAQRSFHGHVATGGATALGAAGARKASGETGPGVEDRGAGLEGGLGARKPEDQGAAIGASPLARGAAPAAFTAYLDGRSGRPLLQADCLEAAPGRASRCGPRRRLVGIGQDQLAFPAKLLLKLLQLGRGQCSITTSTASAGGDLSSSGPTWQPALNRITQSH